MTTPHPNRQWIGCLLVGFAGMLSACTHRPPTVGSASAAPRTEASVRPGINDRFLQPDMNPDQWVERFEGESREIFTARQAIVRAVGLKRGHAVADIGAGTGLFTLPFAREVGPTGWVYAVEIAPAFVQRIGGLADEQGFDNITPLLGSDDHVRLAPGSVDVAFVCDTYHHFEFPKSTLASIRQALRPRGRLVIIDFERIPGVSREWVMDHVRCGKDQVRQEVESAGFHWVGEEEIPGLEENYCVVYRRAG